jgi:hypothetical protein
MTRSPAEIFRTLEELRKIHIPTERDREVRAQLERLLRVDNQGNLLPEPVLTGNLETRGIALIESAGGGKTTAVRRTLENTAALGPDPDTGNSRFLEMQVPSPATLKSLGLAILAELGFKDILSKPTIWEIWSIVRHQFRLKGIVVLWFDEAHDLFQSGSHSDIDEMLKMIKSLMKKETGVIVIMSGTERLSEITSFDAQVSRRFTKIVPSDLVQGADNEVIEGVIAKYAKGAGLKPDLKDNVAGRLIHGSRGRFGRAIETTIFAIERALRDGDQSLRADHFAEAWGAQEGCSWDENVFVAADWASLRLDEGSEKYEAARNARVKPSRRRR